MEGADDPSCLFQHSEASGVTLHGDVGVTPYTTAGKRKIMEQRRIET